MPDTYLNILKKGLAHDVPVIRGSNKDENSSTYGLELSLEWDYQDVNETYSGVWIDRFLELSPANSSTAAGAYKSMFTDRFKVGTWFWTQLWFGAKSSKVCNHFWDHAPPAQTSGAYHESEINYVLNNLCATDKSWTAEKHEIAKKMSDPRTNFIKNSKSNSEDPAKIPPLPGLLLAPRSLFSSLVMNGARSLLHGARRLLSTESGSQVGLLTKRCHNSAYIVMALQLWLLARRCWILAIHMSQVSSVLSL